MFDVILSMTGQIMDYMQLFIASNILHVLPISLRSVYKEAWSGKLLC
jgi:hypothetical protein